MLSEGYFDIEVQRNAIKPLGFQVLDTFADQPLDMTGSNLKCQVRRTGGASSALAANMTVTSIDLKNGQFDITFDGRKFTTGSVTDEALYVYDVLDVAPDGPVVLMRGRIILTPGVTY